jgi:hypothetical protein
VLTLRYPTDIVGYRVEVDEVNHMGSPSRSGRRPRKATTVGKGAAATRSRRKDDLRITDRLEHLVSTLGNNRVAGMLDVSQSQPSRWRRGAERIGPRNERRLLDLDYVYARLLQLFPAEQADIWLHSMNSYLGARPIDVLRLRGAVPVIEAIDAEAEGAFI